MCACAFLLPLSSAQSVLAHGVLPFGQTPYFEDGALVGGQASYGFLEKGAISSWGAEENAASVVLWSHYGGDGFLLAGSFDGVLESEDWGCVWTPQAGALEGRVVARVQKDPEDPTRLFAITADQDLDNGVFESSDSGRNWTQTAWSQPGSNLIGLVVASGGQSAWVLASTGIENTLWRSLDGGVTWEVVAVALEGRSVISLLGLSADQQTLFLADHTTPEVSALLTLNADDSLSEIATFEGQYLTHFAEFAGKRWAIVNKSRLYNAEPGQPFALVEGVPTMCLLSEPARGELWVCAKLEDGANFMSTEDGETWTPHLPYDEICPATCPEGSDGALNSEAFWPSLSATGVGHPSCIVELPEPPEEDTLSTTMEGIDDPNANTGGDDCACRAITHESTGGAPRGVLWLVLGLLWLGLRGRRRRVSPSR